MKLDLTQEQLANIAKYKQLPIKDRNLIMMKVSQLRQQMKQPSPDQILSICKETGHLYVAIDCYAAEITGNYEWRN